MKQLPSDEDVADMFSDLTLEQKLLMLEYLKRLQEELGCQK